MPNYLNDWVKKTNKVQLHAFVEPKVLHAVKVEAARREQKLSEVVNDIIKNVLLVPGNEDV